MEFQYKGKETKQSGNIPQAHLITHESNTMQVFIGKQTQCSKRNTPTYATHGNTYSVLLQNPQAPPTVIYTNPNVKEEKGTSLSARRPLGYRPSSPSGVVTELVPAPARVAGSRRSGFGPSPPRHATPQRLGPQRRRALSTTRLSLKPATFSVLSPRSPCELSLASHLLRPKNSV